MLLGILLMILTLYGLLLFWVLNERLKEVNHLVRELKEKLEQMEKRFSSFLFDSESERRENNDKGIESVEERFSFRFLKKEKEQEKGE
ncbi:MAG: hypothetical protein ACUVQZ_01960 [Candidatus Caldatribacteriaceae bacterium]